MASRTITLDKVEVAICALLLLAIIAVFGQTVQHEFFDFDDSAYIYGNLHVSRGLTTSGVVWAFTEGGEANWIPLTWLSLMLDCQFYDLHAGGHHLTNILLHAATAVLLFLILRRMTGRLWPSALVAALFAVHPLRAESVAWVTERKDVLSGLFFMLTLWVYLGYVRHRFSLARYALLILLFALGLMAKPMLVTLPFVLFLLDYWPLERMPNRPGFPPTSSAAVAISTEYPTAAMEEGVPDGADFWNGMLGWLWSSRHLFLEKIPLFALAAGDCLVMILIQDRTLVSTEYLPLWWRLSNAAIAYVTYLGHFFYPVGLVVVYPRLSLDLPWWQIGTAFLLLASITAAAFLGRRRCPYLLVGWLWYLGMLVPVIGLVQVGCTSNADRFTYLPQIGLAVALVWGAADLCRAWSYRRWAFGLASAAALTVLIGCGFRQTSFWCDGETLWTRTLALTSRNYMAHNGMGGALAGEGRVDEAIAHFRQAITISPNCAAFHANLANALIELGRPDEARAEFRKVLELDSNDAEAYERLGVLSANRGQIDEAIALFRRSLDINPKNSDTCYDLGKALLKRGRQSEARMLFQKAMELVPDYVVVHDDLGKVMAAHGQFNAAIKHFERALDGDPKCRSARLNLGKALSARGRFKDAIAQYRTALRLDPNDREALDQLAWLLATCPDAGLRSGAEAVTLAERASRLCGGEQPGALNTLAAAYAEAGLFPRALATARRALVLARQQRGALLPDDVRAQIALYEAGKPLRRPPPVSGRQTGS
jgi:Flp pilus assembly protein TadD